MEREWWGKVEGEGRRMLVECGNGGRNIERDIVRILDMCYHVQIHNSYGSVRLGTDDPCDFRSSGFSPQKALLSASFSADGRSHAALIKLPTSKYFTKFI